MEGLAYTFLAGKTQDKGNQGKQHHDMNHRTGTPEKIAYAPPNEEDHSNNV